MNNSPFSILAELATKQAIPADNIPRTLSAAKVKNAAANDAALQLPDGGGLLLFVSPAGSKAWRYRFRLDGKGQTLTIGNYPEVGLADARTAHRAARWLVERGTHPLTYIEAEQRRLDAEFLQATIGTFRAVWEQFDGATKANLATRTVRHRKAHVEKYILPKIGDKPVREITRGELASLLSEIDRDKPETARFCRIYIKQVFEVAVDRELISGNPTPNPSTLINQSGRKATPRKAMATGRLGRFLVELKDAADTDPLTKVAMRLLLLTWARTSEIIGAEWREFDIDAAVWRIPAERMKARELHTVYLSTQAVSVLRDLALLSHGRYLFPNRRRPGEAHMSRTTLTQWRNRFGFQDADIHGFRAVASTWANESGKHRPDVIEAALAHKEADRIRAAYNRAEFVAELRTLWQEWADFLDEKEAIERGTNVVAMEPRKAG